MVIKSLFFSLVVSLISLGIVVSSPITITIRSTGEVYSPYLEEILELQSKTEKGLHPSSPVWKALDELSEKNNRWHKKYKEKFLANSSTTALGAWKKKSSFLAPGIMVLWGVLFYFFHRQKSSNTTLLVLVFPVILAMTQLMSFLELVLITFAVMVVWFWFLLNPPNTDMPRKTQLDPE